MGFKDFKDWNPVDTGGLHRHRRDPDLDEPIGKPVEVTRKTLKGLNRLGREFRRYCDHMKRRAHIDTRRSGVKDMKLGLPATAFGLASTGHGCLLFEMRGWEAGER
jgi:hypothetical protein